MMCTGHRPTRDPEAWNKNPGGLVAFRVWMLEREYVQAVFATTYFGLFLVRGNSCTITWLQELRL